jgi:regulator of sirC expression with transglutaminase-like and TPR domain
MNDLLMSEINSEQSNVLKALTLVEESIFSSSSIDLSSLHSIVDACNAEIADIDDVMLKAETLINMLYVEHLFLDKARRSWPVLAHKVASAVDYKIIAPVLKASITQYIIKACGFDVEIVYVPEKIMVRILCDEYYSIIFDPISGESLDWQELDSRLDELGGDPMTAMLKPMNNKSLLIEHLTALKKSLINELFFDKALRCVDLLLALIPNDPFERRDRGFLLHQLDCFKVAYDDYQFFVEQCPQDPAARLLKIQLDKITITKTVFH